MQREGTFYMWRYSCETCWYLWLLLFVIVNKNEGIFEDIQGISWAYQCHFSLSQIDLSKNGPCRVYGCSSDQCQSVAQKLCRDEPDSNSGIACAIEKKPQCRAPCTAAPDPEMKDMDPMDVRETFSFSPSKYLLTRLQQLLFLFLCTW